MKTTLLILFLAAATVFGATDDPSMPPLKAISRFGSITITDGSSFFTFAKDGSFQSGPLGMSGREFEGRWTADDLTFTVITKMGWMNGASSGSEYRRIVFVIYDVQKRPREVKPSFGPRHPDLYDGYFSIDELAKIAKPEHSSFK